MRKKIYYWLGREFVELSGDSHPAASVAEETSDLFHRFTGELQGLGFSLENVVRTRIWGRDREARNLATAERAKILAGRARASSSSYVAAHHFDSGARVGLDLIAMRPSRSGAQREPVEFEPPRNYLCYLSYDSLVFCSGFTSGAATLELQLSTILTAIDGALAVAGTDWNRMVKLSLFLHRSQKHEVLRELLANPKEPAIPKVKLEHVEFGFVDGFAGEKSLIEVEATATSAS